MAKNNVQLAKVLIESIEELINSKLGNLRLNRKKKAVIQSLNVGGTVNLTIDGEEYNDVKVRAGLVPQVGEVVFVEIPNNQFKDMFVDTAKILISTDQEANHTHNNLGILQTITQALIDKWNTVSTKADKIYVDTGLGNKVDKIAGKGLSDESYTLIEKNKLAGIESGANKYAHPSTHSLDIITETTTKKIMTSSERDKLTGISSGANKVENSSTNGNIKIDGVEQAIYTHPTGTNPHGTTKSDLNLGNVENKSSSTIRSEITSTNVTSALGFTPENTLNKGKANGYAPLDSNIKIPLSVLPDIAKQQTYVVGTLVDRNNLTSLIMGEKCYVTSTGDSYIWDGDSWEILAKADWENVNLQWTNIVGKPSSNVADIDNAVSVRHTHGNKSVIDSITQTLIDRWNSAWTHISDTIKHITAAERSKWNAVESKADATYVNTELNKKSDKGHLHTELDITDLDKYTKVETDAKLSGKVDNSRVLTDVPLNAKFTDTNTTYAEITTAEIDAGTASTLRTISARRIKYILDKVAGMISSLTKADVGLSNVDNTSDANKPISTATQTALNGKVDNSQVLTNVPANAKFTDTVYTHPSTHPASIITGLHEVSTSGKYVDLANKPLDDNFYGLSSIYNALGEDELLIYQQSTASYKKINKENFLSDANSSDYVLIIKREQFTSTLNQALFTLMQGEYVPNNSRVKLYIGGLLQPDDSYLETNSTTITLKQPIDSGADVVIEYIQLSNVMDYVHAQNHKIGGSDPITPQDIGAEPSFNKNTAFNKNFGTTAGTVCQGNDSRLSNARVPLAHDHNEIYYTESEVNALLTGKVDSSQVLTDVPLNAKFTDTIYTHPTTAGNKHIPTGGAANQILRYSASGTAVWSNETNTTYTAGLGLLLTGTVFTPVFGTTANTITQGNDSRLSDAREPLAHDHQALYYDKSYIDTQLSNKVDSSQVLTNVPLNAKFTDTNTITTVNGKTGAISKADIVALGIPAQDTIYTHPTTSGNKHIPSGGASGQFLKWSADGTAIWDTVPGGLELGDGSGNAYPGNKGKVAYDHSQTPHNYEPANSNIQTHIGTTGNPHGTTKSNVGLGSVRNYGLATQSEAEAGTSNVKYMTPLRTKQAIDNNKPYHAGISPPSSTNLFWVDTR